MPPTPQAGSFAVYRCASCGKLEVRLTPRPDNRCPECGATGLREVNSIEEAHPYSPAERERGPSIEDHRFGRLAYFAGWMTFEQISQCLLKQKEAIQRRERPPRFGEAAVEAGFLSTEQVEALLRIQTAHNGPQVYDCAFGAIAVHSGCITREQLDTCLVIQKGMLRESRRAPLLGAIMIENGLMTPEQVQAILESQAMRGAAPLAKARQYRSEGAPPSPPPAKPTPTALLCRCKECGYTTPRPSWTPEDVCPQCRSTRFAPVPAPSASPCWPPQESGPGPSIEDNRIGRMAYFAGWMTREQVQTCLQRQREAAGKGAPPARFGAIALRENYLTRPELDALLRMQAIHRPGAGDRVFGAIAVRKGFITQEQLDDCLASQMRLLRETSEAPSLGLLMSESGLLTDQQIKAILLSQARFGQGLVSELEAERAKARTWALRLLRAPMLQRWRLTIGSILILIAIVGWATRWFGRLAPWTQPPAIIGCGACHAILKAPANSSPDCPVCKSANTRAPIARCQQCGHVFLFGAMAEGRSCPKCRGASLKAVTILGQAQTDWRPTPRTASP